MLLIEPPLQALFLRSPCHRAADPVTRGGSSSLLRVGLELILVLGTEAVSDVGLVQGSSVFEKKGGGDDGGSGFEHQSIKGEIYG